MRDLGQLEAELVVAADERIDAGCWSPDGQAVAFFHGGRLETLALGSAKRLTPRVPWDGRTYIGTHLDGFALAGDVPAGAVMGYVGDSGNAVGSDPHLHFEILVDGAPINPYPILSENGC